MGIIQLKHFNLFWTEDPEGDLQAVGVRDIYKLEFQLFKNPYWAAFYAVSVLVFMTHACLGWQKVTPALGIPNGHIKRVNVYGYLIFLVLGAVYLSFVMFCYSTQQFAGDE